MIGTRVDNYYLSVRGKQLQKTCCDVLFIAFRLTLGVNALIQLLSDAFIIKSIYDKTQEGFTTTGYKVSLIVCTTSFTANYLVSLSCLLAIKFE